MKTKIALRAILVALCFILTYVELLIPINLVVPGAKLGFSNIVVLFALYNLDTKSAFVINVVRITLSAVLFSTPITWAYSVTGGILSFFAMYFVKKIKPLSEVSVSATGGIFHNVGQILVATFIFSTIQIVYYLPFLMIIGMLTGILNGYIAAIVNERLKKMNIKTGLK